MKLREVCAVMAGLAAVFLMYKNAEAAYLILTRIGTISTSSQYFSSWTYTSPSTPDLAGTATPGAMVAVTVNALTATTSAGVDGSWRAVPTNIVAGTNTVSIASGNEVIAFSLVYSPAATPTATPTANPTATPSALPAAGVMVWPLGIIAAGLVVFFAGRGMKDQIDDRYSE